MANAAGERTIDPVRDLVPVCPNCHRMLHHTTPLLTPQELAALLAAARSEGGFP
jgi:predicted HNH restriction endonuclease